MITHNPVSSRRGFTLTELAIVLGIIGTILGGIWTAASMAHSSQIVDTSARQVVTIAQNIRSFYSGRTQIAPSLVGTEATTLLANAGVFPPDMQMQTVTDPNWGTYPRPANAFGGYVAIHIISSNTFRVSYYNLSSMQCTQLAAAVIQINNSSSGAAPVAFGSWYTTPATGGTGPQGYGSNRSVNLGPGNAVFTPDIAVTLCGSNASSGESAEFDFNI